MKLLIASFKRANSFKQANLFKRANSNKHEKFESKHEQAHQQKAL